MIAPADREPDANDVQFVSHNIRFDPASMREIGKKVFTDWLVGLLFGLPMLGIAAGVAVNLFRWMTGL